MRVIREASNKIGTCQICGSQQKLPSGRMAYHGYTVQFGFFSGICQGSKNLPYEESRDLIPTVIKKCKDGIEDNKKRINFLKKKTDNKVSAILNRNLYTGYVEKTDKIYFVYKTTQGIEKREKISRMGYYGNDVADAVKKLRGMEILRFELENKQIKKTIDYLQNRYDVWEPKETETVELVQKAKDADKQARAQFRASMKYSYTTPNGDIFERKKVQGKDIAFVLLAELDKSNYDYRRNKGYTFVRGFTDLASAEKSKKLSMERDKDKIDDAIKHSKNVDHTKNVWVKAWFPNDYVIVSVN